MGTVHYQLKRKDRNQQGIKLISNEAFNFATNVAQHLHQKRISL